MSEKQQAVVEQISMIDTSQKSLSTFTPEDQIIWTVLLSHASFHELKEMWSDFDFDDQISFSLSLSEDSLISLYNHKEIETLDIELTVKQVINDFKKWAKSLRKFRIVP